MSSPTTPLKRDISEYRRKLSGIIDLQIHLAPDIVQRTNSEITFARQAREAGYYGWLSKCHHMITAGRNVLIPDSDGIKFFGSVALNNSMGGLNPYAVEVALKLGASQIWFPTLDAENHITAFGQATLPTFKQLESSKSKVSFEPRPITVLDSSGELKEDARKVIEAMRDSGVILGTGHLSLQETTKVMEYAKQQKVTNILVTHPEFKATFFNKEQQRALAESGAILEHCATVNYNPKLISENIRFVGVSHCVISSDAGQPVKGNPIDVMYDLIVSLESEGLSTSEIQRLTIDNPKKLLGV